MAGRVLFVSSNGTGLGHLTRSMAIARRLDSSLEPLFVSLSAAAPIVAEQGFEVEYIASHATPAAGSDWRWSRRLRTRLCQVFGEAGASVLVFDGAHPYQGLVDALPAAGAARRVWCRRPMWLPGSNVGALGRTGAFHHVLEPGEFAAELDRGPTVARRAEAHQVAPIVFCDDDELLDREAARSELGIEGDEPTLLIALGQGDEVRDALERCLAHVAGRQGLRVAALSSALADARDVPPGVVHLRATYPMSRYLRAFDAAVSAAGYNAYHELIRFGVPTLYVPMARRTDDQAARARFAERSGVGLAVAGPGDPDLERRLEELLDPAVRERLASRLAALRPENGAEEAARWVAELASEARGAGSGSSGKGGGGFSRITLETLPQMPKIAAAIAYQTAIRRPARTLVLAPGVGEGELLARVGALIDEGRRASSVLVVVDSLALLAPLRARGVAVEHVPAEGSRAHEVSGLDWPEFFARRLEAILSERPSVRTVIEVGDRVPASTLKRS